MPLLSVLLSPGYQRSQLLTQLTKGPGAANLFTESAIRDRNPAVNFCWLLTLILFSSSPLQVQRMSCLSALIFPQPRKMHVHVIQHPVQL